MSVRFKGLDLNLLVAFEALMQTRNVSRAAERLNLSQPALSAALGRLREYFQDELFVQHGKRMLPTAFAESLHPQVVACLSSAESLVATKSTFDAATSQRVFKLVASDYAIASVLARVAEKIALEAPGVSLEFSLPDDHARDDLDNGRLDLFMMPDEYASREHPAEFLFEENHVIAGWCDNPLLASPISIDDFFGSGQVGVSFGRFRQPAFADGHITSLGRPRLLEIVVPSFTLVPMLLVRTARLAVMHERLVRVMAERYPITWQPLPFEIPVMREIAQFHSARIADEGLRWLRDLIRETGNEIVSWKGE